MFTRRRLALRRVGGAGHRFAARAGRPGPVRIPSSCVAGCCDGCRAACWRPTGCRRCAPRPLDQGPSSSSMPSSRVIFAAHQMVHQRFELFFISFPSPLPGRFMRSFTALLRRSSLLIALLEPVLATPCGAMAAEHPRRGRHVGRHARLVHRIRRLIPAKTPAAHHQRDRDQHAAGTIPKPAPSSLIEKRETRPPAEFSNDRPDDARRGSARRRRQSGIREIRLAARSRGTVARESPPDGSIEPGAQ